MKNREAGNGMVHHILDSAMWLAPERLGPAARQLSGELGRPRPAAGANLRRIQAKTRFGDVDRPDHLSPILG